MSPSFQLIRPAQPPAVMLFDWHGTLVDTHDAMFSALGEMLTQLDDLGLVERLLPESLCKTAEDAKLVRYIRIFRRMHPRILAERRVSRTDIFNAIFGDDREAKTIAHAAYNRCYRKYFGDVKPSQGGVYAYLTALRHLGIRLGIATNRSREFLDQELATLEGGRWQPLFDVTLCADDVTEYKPDPQILLSALAALQTTASPSCWYVGDSQLDMLTATHAGMTPVFFNGACWSDQWLADTFPRASEIQDDALPVAILSSFEGLFDLLAQLTAGHPGCFNGEVAQQRPAPHPGPRLPMPRQEADWHPSLARLSPPGVILFDWHATLVDTLDAMYHAVDDMLPEFETLGLMARMMPAAQSKTPEDARLIEYVRDHAQLHPKIKADRKISRTDIFEVLFGEDEAAKQLAHQVFNRHYRNHYGTVAPFEPQVRSLLIALRNLNIKVGVITNRDREFFEHELAAVEGVGWSHLFDVAVCGDDTPLRKPHPDQLLMAAAKLGVAVDQSVWYVGDSTTDVIAAKRAGMTAVFFNGALWDLPWLQKIFPGNPRHPHKPDVVVNDFSEFWAMLLACRG